MPQPASERRRWERIACYLVARNSALGGEEEDFFGWVRNISVGGAMLESEQAVAVDSRLNLTLLQDGTRQIWEGTGRVIWVRTQGAKSFLGIQFDQPLMEGFLTALDGR